MTKIETIARSSRRVDWLLYAAIMLLVGSVIALYLLWPKHSTTTRSTVISPGPTSTVVQTARSTQTAIRIAPGVTVTAPGVPVRGPTVTRTRTVTVTVSPPPCLQGLRLPPCMLLAAGQ